VFGKPHWFKVKTFGWGLVPIRWQGWLYAAGWAAAIALPFMLLISRRQPVEAMAWLGLAVGWLVYDVRQIVRSIRGPLARSATASASGASRDDRILYISDSRAH